LALAVKDLIDAGVHFGHRASRWNPKMKPYIYGKRNLIHIIDLKETVRGLLRATKYFQRVAAGNGLILFVGTKRQAADIIVEECGRAGMPYVTERWLGGTLTNFRTIRSRLDRLTELESILDSEQALSYSKKMVSTLTRERKKISRNLEGIRHMTRLPEALFVIDPHREKIAVSEARKLGIKVVALLDTDCDPDLVDLPIPGNDDSMRSIELIVKRLVDAAVQGKAEAPAEPPPRQDEAPSGRGDRGERGERGDRRGGGGGRGGPVGRGGQPGVGASRGMAARTGGGNPVLAPTQEAGGVVEHGPEGGETDKQQADVAPLGTEPQAGLNENPPPVENDVPTIAPAVPETQRPGSRGETDVPPSAEGESNA
jgi:small subunit ribosomal protein S2